MIDPDSHVCEHWGRTVSKPWFVERMLLADRADLRARVRELEDVNNRLLEKIIRLTASPVTFDEKKLLTAAAPDRTEQDE